jgi:hypothetical protein
LPDSRRPFGVPQRKVFQASPQPKYIELIDGEHANAARRTSLPADKPTLASARRIRQCGVDDLNQFLVRRRWKTNRHIDEDTSSGKVPRYMIFNRCNGIFELD